LKNIREGLDLSQSELAKMLGISIRAVQSYEQGWRSLPAHVQCKTALMIFLNWRKDQKKVQPCWDIQQCPDEARSECAAYLLKAGDFCWLLANACCRGQKLKSFKARMARCTKCPSMTRWLQA
jgi:DNA-binding XRE family transcriptional regulator